MRFSSHIFFLFVLLTPNIVTSANVQQNIDLQLNNFLNTHSKALAEKGYRSEYIVGNIDPRLRLKDCVKPINFTFNRPPLSQNNVTVKVVCDDIKSWKLYMSVEFNIYGSVITAATAIRRGQVIQRNLMSKQEQLINRSHYASYSSKDSLIGMIAKRSIRSGTIIQANYVAAPKLVKRGDNVTIVASNDAISVRMNGTALMDGSLGQQISVKNNQSKRIIKARVSEPGLVKITL